MKGEIWRMGYQGRDMEGGGYSIKGEIWRVGYDGIV